LNKSKKIIVLLVVIFILATVLSFFSSSLPDGLEFVAEKLGFAEKETQAIVNSPAPDYSFGFIKDGTISKIAASIAGITAVLLAGWGLEKLLRKK